MEDLLIASHKETRRNRDIRTPKVRVIGSDGSQIGVMLTVKALEMAMDEGLELVEISPNADPPVCKIMDYGKFKFEQAKKNQAAKKKQKQVQLKEIKFRPGTEEGDYQVKLRNIRKFIDHGDKVKLTIRFRGRELAHKEVAMDMMRRLEADLKEEVVIEQRPRMEGRLMVMMISPKKA
ncbi:MAG: translation initiation factor IF-3 [bacterium]